jgi:hypothetical protein
MKKLPKRMVIRTAIIFLFLCSSALASPSISSVSGTVSEGETLIISGSGFGSHGLDIEWLGNASGNIEQGTLSNDFSKSGWSTPNGVSDEPIYDDTYAWSGSQSIKALDTTTNSVMIFDYGSGLAPGETVFLSWWTRIQTSNNSGQWKMFRLSWREGWTDTSPELPMFNHDPVSGQEGMKQIIERAGGSEPNDTHWFDEDEMPLHGKWQRMDFLLEFSTVGNRDGLITYQISDPAGGSPIITCDSASAPYPNWMSYGSGETERLRYFVWQNYFGNGLVANAWIDDIYIQVGTQARVEICDNAVWANCTFREIQNPTNWNTSSITIDLNEGGFADVTSAYLFVVDSSGNVSASYDLSLVTKSPISGITID